MYLISCTLRRSRIAWSLAGAFLLGGCHSNTGNTSGYGVAWVTLGTVPAPIFASYVVSVDSVTLTDTVGNTFTALSTAEPVDFVKLRDVREIWGSATIPNDTYRKATIVMDYTNAEISVLVNGAPQRATVIGAGGAAITTIQVVIDLDSAQQLIVVPSYSTDNAQLLAINFDLPASNQVNLATSPATVTVTPFLTAALAPPDNELIRVRGPLINSSVPLGTFTVYERPFYDQASSLGSLTLFNDASTIFTVDGVPYTGTTGLNILSQSPAGVTMTTSYTTFEPTATTTAFAGKFNTVYVVGGSGVQSSLTENISGEVIAISSNAATGVSTLTLRGATVYGPLIALPQGYFGYQDTDSQLLVGPGTVVALDDSATATKLNYKSISVGDYVEAVGAYACVGPLCTTNGTGVWTIDATSPDTGKVRLQQNQIYGTLLSASAGSLSLALQAINYWPASDFDFAGTGTSAATDSSAADYRVATGTLDLSTIPAGTPLWIDGLTNDFGAAPPDFTATSVNQQSGVPAQLLVSWSSPGTVTPFTDLTNDAAGVCCVFAINLQGANLSTAILQIGAESIALDTLPASPQIVATIKAISITGRQVFSPHFGFSTVSSVAAVDTVNVQVFTNFQRFVQNFVPAMSLSSPAYQLTANGTYDSASNTFTANTVSVVL